MSKIPVYFGHGPGRGGNGFFGSGNGSFEYPLSNFDGMTHPDTRNGSVVQTNRLSEPQHPMDTRGILARSAATQLFETTVNDSIRRRLDHMQLDGLLERQRFDTHVRVLFRKPLKWTFERVLHDLFMRHGNPVRHDTLLNFALCLCSSSPATAARRTAEKGSGTDPGTGTDGTDQETDHGSEDSGTDPPGTDGTVPETKETDLDGSVQEPVESESGLGETDPEMDTCPRTSFLDKDDDPRHSSHILDTKKF